MNSNITIRSRAPLRLGLAGGGTDVAPYSYDHGGNVLNATIDLYAQTIIKENKSGFVKFIAADINKIIELPASKELSIETELPLHSAIYNRVVKDFNNNQPICVEVTTFSDAPPGSGLGSSSTMVVSILRAFLELLDEVIDDYALAKLAYDIERVDLNFAGGTQDQYSAVFGGFNFYDFGPKENILVMPLRLKQTVIMELEASIVLFYTGKSRSSSDIINDQINNASKTKSIEALDDLKSNAHKMKSAVLRGDLNMFSDILSNSWKKKKQLSESISNNKLDQIYDLAIKSGAKSGKISGAGGGGFFIFFVEPKNRFKLTNALSNIEGQIINFHFELKGVKSWKQKQQ